MVYANYNYLYLIANMNINFSNFKYVGRDINLTYVLTKYT